MEQKSNIHTLIDKYKSIFAKDKYNTDTVRDYEAHIDLKIDKYCSKKPYRYSKEDRNEIEKQISELLGHDLIDSFAAPVTLAFKRKITKSLKSA